MTKLRTIALVGVGLAALPAQLLHADHGGYQGTVEAAAEPSPDGIARGTVFEDTNQNSRLDAGEAGIAGVMVSNGR